MSKHQHDWPCVGKKNKVKFTSAKYNGCYERKIWIKSDRMFKIKYKSENRYKCNV